MLISPEVSCSDPGTSPNAHSVRFLQNSIYYSYMNHRSKGFVTIFLLVLFTLLVAAGISYAGYIYSKPQFSGTSTSTDTGPITYQYKDTSLSASGTSSPDTSSSAADTYSLDATHPLSVCGITVLVKNGDNVIISSGLISGLKWAEMAVGEAMPKSDLDISCQQKIKTLVTSSDKLSNSISYMLSTRSSSAAKVSIGSYQSFSTSTQAIIPALYSVKNSGSRSGSETIGFASDEWLYTFSFLHPAQARNQNTFVITVHPPVTPVPPPLAATSTSATNTATTTLKQ
jgi:hypothetical protein